MDMAMHKVLIADDELPVRERFAFSIPWEKHGFQFLGAAQNGLEALQMMERELPHILLADISMPLLDGLELAEEVVRRWPKVRVIFLTAHDKFDYVKRALQLGAKDYLLKVALPKEQIIETCLKAAAEVEKELKQEAEASCTERLLKEERWKSAKAQMQRFLDRERRHGEGKDWPIISEALHRAKGNASLIWIGWNAFSALQSGQLAYTQMEDVQWQFSERVAEHPPEGAEVQCLPCKTTRLAVIASAPTHVGFASVYSRLARWLQETLGEFRKCAPVEPFAYIEPLPETEEEARTAFQAGYEMLSSYFYRSAGAILTPADSIRTAPIGQSRRTELLTKAAKACYGGELENLLEVKSLMTQKPAIPFRGASLLELAEELVRSCTMLDKETIRRFTNLLAYVERWEDYTVWCDRVFDAIAAGCGFMESGTGRKEIRQVCQYIKTHYREEVRLTDLAELVQLNASYLGQLFRLETGTHFSDYLNHVRILKAKELLEEGNLKVYEIANSVGISDYRYFCKIFKRKIGVSPTEYKRTGMKPSLS